MERRAGIAGIGCALLDVLYPDADFTSTAFAQVTSRAGGDGGLVPGQLVFAEALEAFAGRDTETIVGDICGPAAPAYNLGGPAIVALVHAAQVLSDSTGGGSTLPVRYFGLRGDDAFGAMLRDFVAATPLPVDDYRVATGSSPSTRVLSDPRAANGEGERTFINTIGVADRFLVRSIPAEFFAYDVAFFGGTALVPNLHADLGRALHSSRSRGQFTVVATVFDFKNEAAAPEKLWPLGDGQNDYPLIDLLITDAEEARRLSGYAEPEQAVRQFLAWGAGSAIVTSGGEPVTFAAREDGRLAAEEVRTLPVSDEVRRRGAEVDSSQRDTTGCGDNFAGGVIAEIARQRAAAPEQSVRLEPAVIEGICAGAAAWFQLGGTFVEPEAGAAVRRLQPIRTAYLRQIGRI